MHRILTLWFVLVSINLGYGQTNVKKIDSLIYQARITKDETVSSKLLDLITKESKVINYKKGLASAGIIKGINLFNAGKYAETLEFTYKVEQMVLDANDNEIISNLYALRSNCFTQLSFFEKSKEDLIIAKQYADKIEDNNKRNISLGRIYRIIAANFKKDGKHKNLDSTLYYLKRSYRIQKEAAANDLVNAGLVLQGGVLGLYYFDIKKLDSAKHYYREAIATAEKHNLIKYAVYSMIGLGKINFQENKIDSALFYYAKAKDIATQNNSGLDLKDIYHNLAITYNKAAQYELSNDYYKKYAHLADSIMLANKDVSSLVTKYIINEQNIVRQKQDQIRNVYLSFAGLVTLLSIFIIFILYKNISASKKSNRVLNRVNKEMAEQNEYLQSTLSALEQSHEDNNRVMQIITHDLRSPMAAIVGLSDFMIKEHNLSEEDLEVINLINTSGIDSLNFINEILQKETDAASLKKESVNLQQLVNYCITQSQFKAKEKRQKIRAITEDIIAVINREKIWRVISNLVNNAIKFSAEDTTIRIELKVAKGVASFSVTDSGIGIPADLKDKIFSKSDEGKRRGTAGEASFGVGLSICKQIVEAHGGKLWFDSKVGVGTTFYFTLPI